MSSYLVYICQAVNDRAGLERYWQEAPAVYPKNIDVLVAYGPSEVLDADQDERVEGVVIPSSLHLSRRSSGLTVMHMSKPAKTEQMAMNISAWSWTVESRLSVNAVPGHLPMSSSFAVKL
jgi:hypothetical protein